VEPITILACPECDLLHQTQAPARGTTHLCGRCGAVLARGGAAPLGTLMALHLTALILLALANAFPLFSMNLHGTVREASIPGCVRILATLGWPWLAATLLTTVILGPLVYLSGMLLVLAEIARGEPGPGTARLFRVLEEVRNWGMAEVFILGVMVCYAKLARTALVVPGPALFALAGFILVSAAAISATDPRAVWRASGTAGPVPPALPGASGGLLPGNLSARRCGLQACHTCGALGPLEDSGPCPRCGAGRHSRIPESLTRTWALLATSAILYLPANVLPVTQVVSLGRPHTDTILSGVAYFLHTGSWPLALLIFVASVVVPVLKFGLLLLLLVSVRRRWRSGTRQRARLYRLTDLVGRWSMVDIFAITLTVAMLHMGAFASVEPRQGAMAFAMMVVATILAVRSFDPRLLWDAQEPDHG
jgi:paraquat-inducible protein A